MKPTHFIDLTSDHNPQNGNQSMPNSSSPPFQQQNYSFQNNSQFQQVSTHQRNNFVASQTFIPNQQYNSNLQTQNPNLQYYPPQTNQQYQQYQNRTIAPPIINPNNPYHQNIVNTQKILNQYVPPSQPTQQFSRIKCNFSLVTPQEFTIRVESGHVPSQIFTQFRRIEGVRFDWDAKRFVFPINRHDILLAYLTSKLFFDVEPIPRAVITAASLKQQSNSTTAKSDQEKEAKLNKQLSSYIPDYLLENLAIFQKEAIQFIIEKNGRALIGDEMGLGKTRTGIAASYVYAADWPALIVCPSSARHHWHAELQTLLVYAREEQERKKKLQREQDERANENEQFEKEIGKEGDEDNENQEEIESEESEDDEEEENSVIVIDDDEQYETNSVEIIDLESPRANPVKKEQGNNSQKKKKKSKKKDTTPELPREYPIVQEKEIILIEKANHFQTKSAQEHIQAGYKYYIISYSLISKVMTSLQEIPFNIILADESHYIKSRQAKRTQILLPFIQHRRRAILLSGTPALSRPLELYTQLNALLPTQFNDFKTFAKRYCQDSSNKQVSQVNKLHKLKSNNSLFSNQSTKFKGFGDNAYKGANHTQELHLILTSTIMIRRLKKDILKSLPKKKRYLMKVSITNPDRDQYLKEMLAQLAKYEELIAKKSFAKKHGKSANRSNNNNNNNNQEMMMMMMDDDNGQDDPFQFTEEQDQELLELKQTRKNMLMKLFHESGEIKLEAILPKLNMFFNEKFSGKILLFAHHTAVLDKLAEYLLERDIKFIRIDGSTNSKERHTLTQSFQTDFSIKVAILGITAAGIALTLTSANIVCFLELYWTPGSLIQAEDRVHRIGQLKNVKIFYFFGINTIDELLWPLVRKKMQLLGEFVEGTTDQDLNAAVLNSNPNTKSESSAATVKKEAATLTPNPPLPPQQSKEEAGETERNHREQQNKVSPSKDLVTPMEGIEKEVGKEETPKKFVETRNDEEEKESEQNKEDEDAEREGEENGDANDPNNVIDPVTKKIYNLQNDEDLLELVDELADEEIRILPPHSHQKNSSSNPQEDDDDVKAEGYDSTEEEFKEFVVSSGQRRNSKKKTKTQQRRRSSGKRRKKGEGESDGEEGDGDEFDDDELSGDEDDEGEAEEAEDVENEVNGEDEYEEYLKRLDPPDVLATQYMDYITRKNNKNTAAEANQQHSSVLFNDLLLSGNLLVPSQSFPAQSQQQGTSKYFPVYQPPTQPNSFIHQSQHGQGLVAHNNHLLTHNSFPASTPFPSYQPPTSQPARATFRPQFLVTQQSSSFPHHHQQQQQQHPSQFYHAPQPSQNSSLLSSLKTFPSFSSGQPTSNNSNNGGHAFGSMSSFQRSSEIIFVDLENDEEIHKTNNTTSEQVAMETDYNEENDEANWRELLKEYEDAGDPATLPATNDHQPPPDQQQRQEQEEAEEQRNVAQASTDSLAPTETEQVLSAAQQSKYFAPQQQKSPGSQQMSSSPSALVQSNQDDHREAREEDEDALLLTQNKKRELPAYLQTTTHPNTVEQGEQGEGGAAEGTDQLPPE